MPKKKETSRQSSSQAASEKALKELRTLSKQAKTIKTDTEEFVGAAKKFAEFAKSNWKSLLVGAAAIGMGSAMVGTTKRPKKPARAASKRKKKSASKKG